MKSPRDANMDQSSFFPILWMNLLTHRHYTSPEGSSGAVERVTRSARARHSASPIMTTSAGACSSWGPSPRDSRCVCSYTTLAPHAPGVREWWLTPAARDRYGRLCFLRPGPVSTGVCDTFAPSAAHAPAGETSAVPRDDLIREPLEELERELGPVPDQPLEAFAPHDEKLCLGDSDRGGRTWRVPEQRHLP